MKTKKVFYYFLMLFPLVITLISLYFLPDKIPMHYDINNEVTRWGNKYESLVFPILTIILGLFVITMTKFSAKQEVSGNNNEKVCILLGISMLLVFNILTFYFLYASFNKIQNLSAMPIEISQLALSIAGAIFIILGNVMPKLRLNSTIGLRTKWSMKNETTWKISQRFGGISFIIAGIIIIITCFITKGFLTLLLVLFIITVLLTIDIIYTYQVSKRY